MHPFPLLEAFWASLDPDSPSGDDPKLLVSALLQFYRDTSKQLTLAAQSRWQTELFQRQKRPLQDNLRTAIEVCRSLSETLKEGGSPSPEMTAKLKTVDSEFRKVIFDLEAEEKEFQLPSSPSPVLRQLNYFFEGWRRGLLSSSPLRGFLEEFHGRTSQTLRDIIENLEVEPKDESPRETELLGEISELTGQLERQIGQLRDSLTGGPSACVPLVGSILKNGEALARAYSELEQCRPASQDCPFCGGVLALTGKCQDCGRLLPHLDEKLADTPEGDSAFRALHLRALDEALLAWEKAPEREQLWRDLQQAVKVFDRQIEQAKREFEHLSGHSERPIASDHPDRVHEETLRTVGELFVKGRGILSRFAFQPFPPHETLPTDWRDPLLEAEDYLWELEEAAGHEGGAE